MLRPFLSFLTVLIATTLLGSIGDASAAPGGKRVTRVLIKKNEHALLLLAGPADKEETVASYRVAIGPGGAGPKRKEGDQVTPIGRYHVTMHQPSQYKVFMRLDYPNSDDFRRFEAARQSGTLPKGAKIGGDIGIHGPPVSFPAELKPSLKDHDWTLGCIALDADEIAEVARLVRDGTPVDIED